MKYLIKKLFILVLLFGIFMLITNLTIVKYCFPGPPAYQYQTSDGVCYQEVWKRRDPYQDVALAFEEHKSKKADQELNLYRCFRRDWTLVWEWFDYFSHKRFKHKRIECRCK